MNLKSIIYGKLANFPFHAVSECKLQIAKCLDNKFFRKHYNML
jgi:hypothetical protein